MVSSAFVRGEIGMGRAVYCVRMVCFGKRMRRGAYVQWVPHGNKINV